MTDPQKPSASVPPSTPAGPTITPQIPGAVQLPFKPKPKSDTAELMVAPPAADPAKRTLGAQPPAPEREGAPHPDHSATIPAAVSTVNPSVAAAPTAKPERPQPHAVNEQAPQPARPTALPTNAVTAPATLPGLPPHRERQTPLGSPPNGGDPPPLQPPVSPQSAVKPAPNPITPITPPQLETPAHRRGKFTLPRPRSIWTVTGLVTLSVLTAAVLLRKNAAPPAPTPGRVTLRPSSNEPNPLPTQRAETSALPTVPAQTINPDTTSNTANTATSTLNAEVQDALVTPDQEASQAFKAEETNGTTGVGAPHKPVITPGTTRNATTNASEQSTTPTIRFSRPASPTPAVGPMPSTPVQAAPIVVAPVQTIPVQATPVQAMPVTPVTQVRVPVSVPPAPAQPSTPATPSIVQLTPPRAAPPTSAPALPATTVVAVAPSPITVSPPPTTSVREQAQPPAQGAEPFPDVQYLGFGQSGTTKTAIVALGGRTETVDEGRTIPGTEIQVTEITATALTMSLNKQTKTAALKETP